MTLALVKVRLVSRTTLPASAVTACLRQTVVARLLSTTRLPTWVQPVPGPVSVTVLVVDTNSNRASSSWVAVGVVTLNDLLLVSTLD